MKWVEILDSTLRDGAQGEGISFSVEDKLDIVKTLDEMGIPLIEAGNPVSNVKDLDFFEQAGKLNLKNSLLCAFGSTRRKDTEVFSDNGCLALLSAKTPVVSIVGKSSMLHVEQVLKTGLYENLMMIEETCRFFKENGKRVIFDAEHFFDAFKTDSTYPIECLQSALRGGADTLTLCDTNGGNFPDNVAEIVQRVLQYFPKEKIGIHAHDDSGMATACSVLAVKAGATHVQGTFIGFGERCGNANLSAVIPNLQLKAGLSCIAEEKLAGLTSCAIKIAEVANATLYKSMPFVGRSAFAHKAGMHTDAVLKSSETFEHIEPEQVGNRRRFLLSEMTGRAAILSRIIKLYPNFDKTSPVIDEILGELKEKEYNGYQFEGADSSFELIVHRKVLNYKPFFDLISYKVLDELPYDNNRSATATLKIRVKDCVKIAASDGDGPVNALDEALGEALGEFYPCLNELRLVDYKVRVMEPKNATAAHVRVLITTSDGKSIRTTVGASQDIIEASWLALVDAIEHKLVFEGDFSQ